MINPGEIPQIPGDMDVLAAHAQTVKTTGADFADTGQAVDTTWQGLAAVYEAPEAAQLFAATGPVRTVSASVGEDVQAVGTALATYATEVKEIKAQLASLQVQAGEFVRSVEGNDDWREDEGKVNEHNGLISAVNAQVAAFFEAQRSCANTINALYGGIQYRADNADGQADPGEYGFSADTLNAAAGEDDALPWGTTEEHDRGLLGDAGAFFGGIGEGFVNMLGDLGALIGRDPTTGEWSWGAAGQAWTGLGTFVYAVAIQSNTFTAQIDRTIGMPGLERGEAGDILLNAGKSIIAYDTWGEDNARAAGLTTFNVVSAVVGTKGAGAGVRGAGTAVTGIRNSATAARIGAALIRTGNWLDNLPTVGELGTRFAQRFDIQLPQLGLVPAIAGDMPIGSRGFDVEMPNGPGVNTMNMDVNGGSPHGGNQPSGHTPGQDLPGGNQPGDLAPGTEPRVNDPPGNDPPRNDPPGSDPPGSGPSGNDPPGNDPSGNDPPGNDPPGSDPPGNDPPGSDPPAAAGRDQFDSLDPATQQRLIDEVIKDSNKDFPMTRENAEAVLRDGPPGTTPRVAGEGVQGGDVQFIDANGETVLGRENKAIAGGYNSFNKEVKHAALHQLNGSGEVWVQVRPGTDVETWIRRFQGSRTPDRLAEYTGVDVIFRDPDGNVLGEYNLGTQLPPRQ